MDDATFEHMKRMLSVPEERRGGEAPPLEQRPQIQPSGDEE
jgi:hypothetical protein